MEAEVRGGGEGERGNVKTYSADVFTNVIKIVAIFSNTQRDLLKLK